MHISTHTPLAGRDAIAMIGTAVVMDFYSHAPCGARRRIIVISRIVFAISTHTPLAGRDSKLTVIAFTYYISTHTPLAGRDVVG